MKAKDLVLLSILFSWFNLFAQDDNIRFKKNAVSITAPAFTRLFSINYERVYKTKKLDYYRKCWLLLPSHK